MAELKCTLKEFHKFIGPRIRNAIQTLTKKRKKELNHLCQDCGQTKELEAAHVQGNGRKAIIEKTLSKYKLSDDSVVVDLQTIEDEIISAHKPIDKYFKFLCSDCHTKYDSMAE